MSGPVDWDGLLHGPVQSVFGEAVQYRSQSGGSFSVTGIFDNAYHPSDEVSGSFGMGPVHLVNRYTILGVRLSEFPSPPQQGDILSVRGQTYSVQEVRDDSHGYAHLILNEGMVPSELPPEG